MDDWSRKTVIQFLFCFSSKFFIHLRSALLPTKRHKNVKSKPGSTLGFLAIPDFPSPRLIEKLFHAIFIIKVCKVSSSFLDKKKPNKFNWFSAAVSQFRFAQEILRTNCFPILENSFYFTLR